MNSLALARDYLRKARTRLLALEVLYQAASYDDVVREAQEIVELVLKGALRYLGIDPPKRHDVAPLLREYEHLLPAPWRENFEWIEHLSRRLVRERSEAFYGDEASLIPASQLYDRDDADEALTGARRLVQLYEHLVGEPTAPQATEQTTTADARTTVGEETERRRADDEDA